MKTLNEVVETVGLTRRAIQEYEKTGLADKPTITNKYGYLLYDTPAIERLWQLRFYKELGYNMTEIDKLDKNKTLNTDSELERVILKLIEKREKLDNLINIARAMKETGVSFAAFKKTITEEDMDSEDVFGVLGTSLSLFLDVKEEEFNADVISEEDLDDIYDAIERIEELMKRGKIFSSSEIQGEVESIHNIVAKGFSKSIILFRSFVMYLEPESRVVEDLEGLFDKETIAFLQNAMKHYCEVHSDNETDRELCEALDNISVLGMKKHTTNSSEVQHEVKRIHNFFKGMNLLKEDAKLEAVKKIGLLYGSKAYKQMIDNGAKRGVSWFISRAIEIYCNNVEQEEN